MPTAVTLAVVLAVVLAIVPALTVAAVVVATIPAIPTVLTVSAIVAGIAIARVAAITPVATRRRRGLVGTDTSVTTIAGTPVAPIGIAIAPLANGLAARRVRRLPVPDV